MTSYDHLRDGDGRPHVVIYSTETRNLRATCSCGAEWTMPLTVTPDYRDSLEDSHRSYFNRKPLETL